MVSLVLLLNSLSFSTTMDFSAFSFFAMIDFAFQNRMFGLLSGFPSTAGP